MRRTHPNTADPVPDLKMTFECRGCGREQTLDSGFANSYFRCAHCERLMIAPRRENAQIMPVVWELVEV